MKHSIKKQMTVVFISLVICMLLCMVVMNAWFLEPYYISDKENQFVSMYQNMDEMVKEDDLAGDDTKNDLDYAAEKANIYYIIINTAKQRIITNVHNNEMLNQQLMGYLLNQKQKDSKVLESTDNYEISQSKDPVSQSEYLEMWGGIGEGSYFLFRSPLESIQESAALSNRLLLYIGFAVIGICILLVWYFSKRLTDPILELALLSARMADLDFDAKYTSGGHNEIGILGDNFNVMSERLQAAISELKSANYQLQKDIEKKDKLEQMRNEFLGNVSHELKTPIALIQGYAEGLKEGVNADEQSREFYCDVIMDEAAKMNQMVRNLLTLNQLEFGDEDIQFERFDLVELIQGVLQSMEIIAQQKEAKVVFMPEGPVYAWGDEFKAEQVVRNYISNAFNHLAGEMVVEVRIIPENEKVRVSVFNTGTPIPEEDVAHIWEIGRASCRERV